MFLYLIGFVLALVFYLVLIKPLNFWKNQGVAQHHFLKSILEIFLNFVPYRSFAATIQKMYEDFPDLRYCGNYQFYKPSFVLRDPELIKQITVKDFDHFVDHVPILIENVEPTFEKNLMALKGVIWKDMRTTLSPSFTSSKIKIMFSLISDYAKQFVQYFEEHSTEIQSLDMKDTLTRFTNDVIATVAFGCNCDSIRNPNNEFYVMGKTLTALGFWGTIKIVLAFIFPSLLQKLNLSMFSREAINFFKRVIQENIEARERDGIVRPDMLHLLLEAKKGRLHVDDVLDNNLETEFTVIEGSLLNIKEENRKKEPLTNNDITAQALIFFFAGFEAVATLMCFLAYELAINVDIQERLQAEIDDTFQQCNGNLAYEALSKMKYLNMVVAEALRKWPVAMIIDRVCTESYTIEPIREGEVSVTLKAGQNITIPLFGIHRDPNIYPNPNKFDPGRFNSENKSKLTAYQYLPFGVGPRSCIGNRLALLEIKLAFFYILRSFNITVTDKTRVPIALSKKFQMFPKGGFWFGLKKRG